MKKPSLIMGTIGILILIITISGCTSSNNSGEGPYPDIEMANTPTVTVLNDTSVMAGGLIKNAGSNKYENIVLKISIVDRDGNILASKERTLGTVVPGAMANYDATFDVTDSGTVTSADVEVLKATKI